MRAEAGFERAICGIVNEYGIVRTHGEERRIAVDQRSPEALVDTWLSAQASIEIIRRVERIVSFRHIIGEDGGVQFCLFPLAVIQRVGQFFAVHTNLPGKQAIRIQLRFGELRYRGFVVTGQSFKRESTVFLEKNEMVTPLCWSLGDCIQWIGNMLQQKAAVGFEKLPEALRQPLGQRLGSLIDDQSVPVPSPRL